MFTWICPQCGREVPPSYTECPDCAAKAKVPPSPAAEPAQPPPSQPPGTEAGTPPPYYTQSPPYPAPPQGAQPQYVYPPYPPQQYPPPYGPPQGQYPQYAAPYPPHQYQPPASHRPPASAPGRRLPTWLMTVLFTVAFGALVAGVYWLVGANRGSSQAAAPPATVENPAAKSGAKTSPLQKFIEISGLRFVQDAKKKPAVKFIVTNHSDADASGLAGNVTIWARTQKSEEDPIGTFAFKSDVPAQSSQEVTAPLTTKLKMYELPDWQNVNADVQITAPQ